LFSPVGGERHCLLPSCFTCIILINSVIKNNITLVIAKLIVVITPKEGAHLTGYIFFIRKGIIIEAYFLLLQALSVKWARFETSANFN
jgi:hypothetical protein